LSRSRLRAWEVVISTGEGVRNSTHKGQVTQRFQSIAMHTAVDRALGAIWPEREAPTYAKIEVRCLEAKFEPTPFELIEGGAGPFPPVAPEGAPSDVA